MVPVHLAQMNALEKMTQSLFTDQALEQEIKKLKGHDGMVGLSRDEAALD